MTVKLPNGLVDLESLTGNVVPTDIRSYSMFIYGVPKVGKTTFVNKLYSDGKLGKAPLFLGFENGFKNIPGLHGILIDSYTTLNMYLTQLQKPSIREKYDTLVFDTFDQFAQCCKQQVCDTYGKDTIGESKAHGGAYEIWDSKMLNVLKKIYKMGYNCVFISHSKVIKTIDPITNEEYSRYYPKAPQRALDIILPDMDQIWFIFKKPDGERCIYTRESKYYFAGSRVVSVDLPEEMPYDVDEVKRIFAENVAKGVSDEFKTDEIVQHSIPQREVDYKELLKEIQEIGNKLFETGKVNECNQIISRELGVNDDGSPRLLQNCTEMQIPALEMILINLKELL